MQGCGGAGVLRCKRSRGYGQTEADLIMAELCAWPEPPLLDPGLAGGQGALGVGSGSVHSVLDQN